MNVNIDCVNCGSTEGVLYNDKEKEWFCEDCREMMQDK